MPQPSIVEFTHAQLAALGDARKAREMAAYMKTTQPFYGVQTPERAPIFSEMVAQYAPANGSEYRMHVLSLWDAGLHSGDADAQPAWPKPPKSKTGETPKPRRDTKMSPPTYLGPRELMYASCYYAEQFGEHLTPAHLPLFKRLIVEGAWWDIVDWVSDKMVGAAVRTHRAAAAPVMRKWLEDDNLWVRRAAIICQLGHKTETDEAMLFDFCLKRADEEDFFIRKAIGWALRQHARTNPDGVRDFLNAHKPKLAALSVREAGKHIGVKA